MKYLLILLILLSFESNAACRKLGQVCLDSAPCKERFGAEICLKDMGETCWAWQDSYECLSCGVVTTSYCDPLAGMGCYQSTEPECTSYAFDGTCLNTKNIYRCDNVVSPLPFGVTYEREEKFIKSDTIQNNCMAQESNPSCVLTSEVCVEPTETRNIDGLLVRRDCWKWQRTYSCLGEFDAAECSELRSDPTCSLTKTSCTYTNPITKHCEAYEKVYSCREGEDKTQTFVNCAGKVTCIGTYCFDSSHPPDEEFHRATTMMEASRQAGIYDQKGLFGGIPATCHKESTVGIGSSCCDVTHQGDTANRYRYGSTMDQLSLGSVVTKNVFNYMGSTYVHDALFANSLVPDWLLNNTYGIVGGSSYAGGVSYYGLTVNVAVVDGAFKLNFSFDFTTFAIQLALQFIMEAMTCEMSQEEQMLSLRRGSGLCHFVGSWTDKDTFTKTTFETYCCFNSRLAMLINQQGRKQISKPWGTAKEPDCEGFSEDELNSVSFDSIDFSSFYGEIAPSFMDTSTTQTIITDNVNCVAEDNGYDRSTNANCNSDYKSGRVRDLPVLRP